MFVVLDLDIDGNIFRKIDHVKLSEPPCLAFMIVSGHPSNIAQPKAMTTGTNIKYFSAFTG